jgi:hypothetical protein
MNNVTKNLKSYLSALATRRTNKDFFSGVTADDAHRFLDNHGVSTSPVTRLSYINSVLNERNFTVGGTRPSRRPVAKQRRITVWR